MNFEQLGKAAAKSAPGLNRQVRAGRILQYDADFSCYEVADLEQPAAQNFKALLDLLNMKRVMMGAETINAFITLGQKSGREQMATVKPYQENRDPDAPIKVRVRELRTLLANYKPTDIKLNVVACHFYEADDAMCRYQNEANANGFESIIMSGDKDLWMVQGKHADPNTGRLWNVNGYGHTEYREVGNKKPKLVGEGTSWFFHQMIMGDKADNIPGLERIDNGTLDKIQPLKTGKSRKDGSSLCGESKAVSLLKGITDDRTAARAVYGAYWDYYGAQAMVRFVEQAYLLWMQRDDNPWDVIKFMRECGLDIRPTQQQQDIVEVFLDNREENI